MSDLLRYRQIVSVSPEGNPELDIRDLLMITHRGVILHYFACVVAHLNIVLACGDMPCQIPLIPAGVLRNLKIVTVGD